MKKILLISPKDNNFYNFRSELILKLHDLGHEVVLVCPYGKKMDYFTERGCRFIDISMDRRGTSVLNDLNNESADQLVENRYMKFKNIGQYIEQ